MMNEEMKNEPVQEKNQEIYLQIETLEEELPMMLQYKDIDGIPSCALWLGNQKMVKSPKKTQVISLQ